MALATRVCPRAAVTAYRWLDSVTAKALHGRFQSVLHDNMLIMKALGNAIFVVTRAESGNNCQYRDFNAGNGEVSHDRQKIDFDSTERPEARLRTHWRSGPWGIETHNWSD